MRKGLRIGLALVMVFALALTGCAGGQEKKSSSETAKEQPKKKNEGTVSLRVWAEKK